MQEDIQKLRQAAKERDADTLQFLLKKLFLQLEFVIALGISAEQTYRYVDTFERYHEGEIWARRMILQIVNTATAPDRSIIEQAFQHFDTPGSANFIKAMHDLYQGTQKTNQSQARIGFLVSAVVNAMTGELVELYFGERPDDWQAYRAQGENFRQIALDFWTNEAVAERDTQLWLQLADSMRKDQSDRNNTMRLIVLTGLPTKEKAWLTRDLATHYIAQGQRVAVLDNANVMSELETIEGLTSTVPMRGGCACCSVAGKLFSSATQLTQDVDVAIMPANNQTHVQNLAAVLDNLVAGSDAPIEVTTVALVDERTTCCFPYVAETLESYADVTLTAPFSPDKVINVI